MAFSDIQRIVTHLSTTAMGYDSAKAHFVDQSGGGRHLPVDSGAPVFADVAGVNALTNAHDNSLRAWMPVPVPLDGAFILSFYTSLAQGDGVRYLFATSRPDYPNGTHATGVPDFSGITSGNKLARSVGTYGAQARIGRTNYSSRNDNVTAGEWHVLAGGWDAKTGYTYLSVDGGPFLQGTAPPANDQLWIDSMPVLALGYGGGPNIAPLTNGNILATDRIILLSDRIWATQEQVVRAYAADLLADLT